MADLRRRMDAVSALVPFHNKFMEKVKDFVKEKTASSTDTIEDFDQKVNSNIKIKEEIHTLHKIQQVCVDNLKTMLGLYLEKAGRLNPIQHTDADLILYQRCARLTELEGACCSTAKKLNDKVLDSMPDNFNALLNKIMLLYSTGDAVDGSGDEEADDIMGTLEKVIKDTKPMLIAKAEVAGMYTYLEINSESLRNAICLYEEVLDQLRTISCETPSDSMLDRLIVFWKQDLLWNYRLLTFGQWHDKALSRAESLTKELQQSPIVDNKLKAKAWANFALIYEHHMATYQNRWPARTAAERQKKLMRDCYARAMNLDPSNARIYMQAARELRKREKGESSQLKAIEWFKVSLEGEDVEDIRGFTLFHMGLAYRSLWIIEDKPFRDVTVNADLFRSNKHSDHPHFKKRVINPPIQPMDFYLIPPPYKKPDKSVDWRFLNLIARNPNNTYLLEARKCLQEASETEEEERCMFLIELTRTYISTGDITAARDCLQRAQRDPRSDMVSVDFVGVSLHENIAFLEESEMMRRRIKDNEAEKIKGLYRESIRQSTQSGWQPVVAFHCLLALLYKQLETRRPTGKQTDLMILQSEYFLLYMAIQRAKGSRKIVKSFTTDDFQTALMWILIEMFYRRNQEYDAAAAFTYLSILVTDEKLTTEVNGINFTAIEKQRMLLEAAERVAQQRVAVAETRFLLPQYKELCDLCGAHQQSDSAFSSDSESLSDEETKKLNIVMKIIKPEFQTYFSCRKERV